MLYTIVYDFHRFYLNLTGSESDRLEAIQTSQLVGSVCKLLPKRLLVPSTVSLYQAGRQIISLYQGVLPNY